MDTLPSSHHSTETASRSKGIQRTALMAVSTNIVLAIGQVVTGLFANSFTLIADAAHTFSDIVADLFIFISGRRSADPADHDHPYGHGRIETATSLLLGLILIGVGLGFLWSSGIRLQYMTNLPPLHPIALVMALLTLIVKEILFRYMLSASCHFKTPILEASAWHGMPAQMLPHPWSLLLVSEAA